VNGEVKERVGGERGRAIERKRERVTEQNREEEEGSLHAVTVGKRRSVHQDHQ